MCHSVLRFRQNISEAKDHLLPLDILLLYEGKSERLFVLTQDRNQVFTKKATRVKTDL